MAINKERLADLEQALNQSIKNKLHLKNEVYCLQVEITNLQCMLAEACSMIRESMKDNDADEQENSYKTSIEII